MNEQMKYYPWLDVLKYAMAILIVATHCNLFQEWPAVAEIFGHIAEVAVPTFFGASAFLFFSKLDGTPAAEQGTLFRHTIQRLCIFFVVWYVLMLPYSIPHFFMKLTIWKEYVMLLLHGCAFSGYWFIKALIFNTIIVYLCRGRRMLWVCLVLASAIYLMFAFNYVHPFIPKEVHPYFAFYYHTYAFVLGALLARYSNSLRRYLHTFGGGVLLCVVVLLLGFVSPYTRVISKLFYPILLPMSVLLINRPLSPETSKKMRVYSTLYYVSHFIVIFGLREMCPDMLSPVQFVIVLIIVTVFAAMVTYLEKKQGFKFLSYLH